MKIKKIYRDTIVTDASGQVDSNIYIDTDSVFFSSVPLLDHRLPKWADEEQDTIAGYVNVIATEMQDYLNQFYDILSEKVFNVERTKHRFEIKKEYISKAGFWVAKKRYAQWMILKNGIPCDKLDVKGLDVVRSSFPKAFQKFMSTMLKDILMGKGHDYIDDTLLTFKKSLPTLPVNTIAKGGALKELSKYDKGNWKSGDAVANFEKGTPAHVKAGITYNRLLKFFNCPYKHEPIRDGDKVKWVYLKDNPLGLETVAFKDYNDPKEIMDFVETYVDRNKIFEAELENKLDDFYNALKWDKVTADTKTAKKFFAF